MARLAAGRGPGQPTMLMARIIQNWQIIYGEDSDLSRHILQWHESKRFMVLLHRGECEGHNPLVARGLARQLPYKALLAGRDGLSREPAGRQGPC